MKLNNCPFCGNKIDDYDYFEKHKFWYLNCSNCFAIGPCGITKKEAAKLWNKRSSKNETE